MFTRTSFCEHCYHKKQPQNDTLYCVQGSNSRHFIVDYAIVRKPDYGFTPHNFEMLKFEQSGKLVTFQKFCGICGVEIYRKKMKWHFNILKLTTGTMLLSDWEALKKNTQLGYHI